MTANQQSPERAATELSPRRNTSRICPHCGGSGTLRHGDQLFRTCLDCLGQGQVPASVAAELSAPPSGPAQVVDLERRRRISAVASSAAAR